MTNEQDIVCVCVVFFFGSGEGDLILGNYKLEWDPQSSSHALAQAIVIWNLRNAFDQSGVSAWLLFWMTPRDKGIN